MKRYRCNAGRASHPRRLNVGVLYYRPPTLETETFEGGFVAALSALSSDSPSAVHNLYSFRWINVGSVEEQRGVNYDAFDVLLVKSNWEWGVDKAARATLRRV